MTCLLRIRKVSISRALGKTNSLELAGFIMYYAQILAMVDIISCLYASSKCTGGSQGIHGDGNGPKSLDFDSG